MGIILWLLVFGAFVALAGFEDFTASVSQITLSELGPILAVLSVSVVSMGTCLYVIARSLGLGFSPIESIFLNTSVSLAHNLTPFGQAAGVPIGAVVLGDRTDSSYEKCLAALSMKDMVSFVPSLVIFVLVGPYLVLFRQSWLGQFRPLLAAFSLLVFVVVLGAIGVRKNAAAIKRILRAIVGVVNRTVGRIPKVPNLDREEVDRRVDDFSASMGEVAADKQTLVLAVALATSSFVAQGVQLWLVLNAVGISVPIALAIFIYPASLLTSALPLPGGSGAVEGAQVSMILATGTTGTSAIITAVVLSRGLTYWTPIILGSSTLGFFQLQKARQKI